MDKKFEDMLTEAMGKTMLRAAFEVLHQKMGIEEIGSPDVRDSVTQSMNELVQSEWPKLQGEVTELLETHKGRKEWKHGTDDADVIREALAVTRRWSERLGRLAALEFLNKRGEKEKVG